MYNNSTIILHRAAVSKLSKALTPFKSDFANISLQKEEKRGIFNVNLKVNKIFK
jgi:hypothetical protein